MILKTRVSVISKWCLMIVALVGLVSCNGSLLSYRGATVDPDSRIDLLENASYKGTWQTFDLTVTYQYEKGTNLLQLSGVAELSEHYQANYEKLRHLYVTVYFLGADDKVIEGKLILNAVSIDIDGKFRFKRNLEMPPETVAMAFGYDGEVREGASEYGSGGGGNFSKVPRRSS